MSGGEKRENIIRPTDRPTEALLCDKHFFFKKDEAWFSFKKPLWGQPSFVPCVWVGVSMMPPSAGVWEFSSLNPLNVSQEAAAAEE